MFGSCEVIAFLPTARPDRALAFYRDTLGLTLVADEPFALGFEAAGTMLRIQKLAEVVPVPYTALGWKVKALRPTVEKLLRRGVKLEHFPGLGQDKIGIWQAPGGGLVAWFRDPDGNL